MRQDKDKAEQLRKSGTSYKEIRKITGIPISTLSDWFSSSEWSQEIKRELEDKTRPIHTERIRKLGEIRGQGLKKIYAEAKLEAIQEFEILKYSPLFISGIMLYMGEGERKSRGRIHLANTDPHIIKLFVSFLKSLGVPCESIKASLVIYPDHSASICEDYWRKSAGLRQYRFYKTQVIQGKDPKKRLHYGICYIVAHSTYLKTKLFTWTELLVDHLLKLDEKRVK